MLPDDAHHFRDHVAGAPDDDGIADTHVLALYLVGIVQGGIGHGHTAEFDLPGCPTDGVQGYNCDIWGEATGDRLCGGTFTDPNGGWGPIGTGGAVTQSDPFAIAISTDVASHCEFCNIATDRYNTVYANFGSNTGSWIGAINTEGVHPWASQQLPITTSYQTAGMACTPDTSVHVSPIGS